MAPAKMRFKIAHLLVSSYLSSEEWSFTSFDFIPYKIYTKDKVAASREVSRVAAGWRKKQLCIFFVTWNHENILRSQKKTLKEQKLGSSLNCNLSLYINPNTTI